VREKAQANLILTTLMRSFHIGRKRVYTITGCPEAPRIRKRPAHVEVGHLPHGQVDSTYFRLEQPLLEISLKYD